jgi:hypothetical protein
MRIAIHWPAAWIHIATRPVRGSLCASFSCMVAQFVSTCSRDREDSHEIYPVLAWTHDYMQKSAERCQCVPLRRIRR